MSINEAPHGASLGRVGPTAVDVRLPIEVLRGHRYVSLIHPEDSRGVAVMTYSDEVWVNGVIGYRTRSAGAIGSEVKETVRNLRPTFVTMQMFRRPKVGKDGKPVRDHRKAPCKALWNLSALQCITADLDFYRKGCAYRNQTPEAMVPIVLERIRDRNMPYPSYIMCSGKGLLCVWLHDRRATSYLPVWKAMMKRVNDCFIDMGRDLQAMPPTTNFRIAGTKNEGLDVRMLWPEYTDQIHRWDFETLRHEVLPYTPKQVREHRKEKDREKAARVEKAASRKAAGGAVPAPKVKLTRATYSKAVARDLYRLFEARFGGQPVPKGDRDTWLYHLTVASSWTMPPDALREEVKRLAPLCGLAVKRALTLMGSVLGKAKRADQGAVDTYRKRPTDPRYKTNPLKMADLFGVTGEEADELDLRIIVPRATKVDREARRSAKRRLDAGAKPQTIAQAERLADGLKALERKIAGVRVADIAVECGRRETYVRKAMAEARAVLSIGKPQVKAKVGRPRKVPKPDPENHRVSTGSIDAGSRVTGLDADPMTVVARDVEAYDLDARNVHLTMMDSATLALAPVEAGVAISDDVENGRHQKVHGVWRHWDGSRWTPTPAILICLWRLEAGTMDEIIARYPSAPPL